MSGEINTFSDESMRRIAREVFRGERESLALLARQQQRPTVVLKDRGVPFVNDSGETIPPYAVMEVVSIEAEKNGLVHVIKPTARREAAWLINGKSSVAIGANGFGSWAFDKPTLVLCAGAIHTYGSSSDAPHLWLRSFAPRAGYWHLRSDNDASNLSDANVEDFGFKQCGYGGVSVTDYEYDYGGDTNIEYAFGYYFVQQIEQPEISITLELDTQLYNSTFSGETSTIGSTSYLKLANDEHGKQYSRIGLKTVEPDTGDTFTIKLFRSGVYRFDLNLILEFEGNGYDDLFTSTASETASGHTHNYDKIKLAGLQPSKITLVAIADAGYNLVFPFANGSDYGAGAYDLTLFSEPFCYYHTYSSGEYSYFQKHVSFEGQVSLSDPSDGYDPATSYGEMKLKISHVTGNSTTARIKSGQLRITRIREKWRMQE